MPSVQYYSQVMVTSAWWLECAKSRELSVLFDKRASGISDKWNISHVPW